MREPTRPGWRRLAASILISGAAVAFALSLTDLSAFSGVAGRIRWTFLPALVLILLAIVATFAWRWKTLLRGELGLVRAGVVTAAGLGANQILPLRGGDALRVALSARGSPAASIHAGISGLALEKVFDLLAVALFGLASALSIFGKPAAGAAANAVPVAGLILGAALLVLVSARYGALARVLRRSARIARTPPRLYRHLYAPLHHLKALASPGRLGLLLLQTGLIWLVLYVATYLLVARMIGVSLMPSEALVLLFAAAIGLAIPAAPSGIGTFHAAIVSAFVLLGRPASEGLLLAVAIHLTFFVGLCAAGALALPFLRGGERTSSTSATSVR